jgi:uncharacterized membrane protein YgaE (UPF0421/DUF939 family)
MITQPTASTARSERVRLRARSLLRQVLWRVWPASPSSWTEVPTHLRPAAVEIGRLTAAAVISYLMTLLVTPGSTDLTAPLTALLVVQVSAVGTLRMSFIRVGAVLTGVLVAVGVSNFLGLSWWSLAIVVAASLLLAKTLRLGEQSVETPISAMLILAVSSPGVAGEVRVLNTLIGAAVGVGFSLLVPIAIPNTRAHDAVRRVARSQAALLDEVALTLGVRAPQKEEVAAWSDWLDHIAADIEDAESAVRAAQHSRRWNARALAVAKVHPGLSQALERLERCLTAEHALLTAIAKDTSPTQDSGTSAAAEMRGAFAVVLDDLANGLRAFADVVTAEFGPGDAQRVDNAIARSLDIVREARAVLTELTMLDVDPRQHTSLWLLHGSVLSTVDQILTNLDLEHAVGRTEPWLIRHGLPTPPDLWPLRIPSRPK